MISHKNCITNIIQMTLYDHGNRAEDGSDGSHWQDVALGLLPVSHIYGLIVVSFATTFRGDEVVVLPKFDLKSYLKAIQECVFRWLFNALLRTDTSIAIRSIRFMSYLRLLLP
jgi:acyl-CoA synthetase (AMP-forming)/AMP-acid ligase II